MRRRLVSRLRFSVFWEAGRDTHKVRNIKPNTFLDHFANKSKQKQNEEFSPRLEVHK